MSAQATSSQPARVTVYANQYAGPPISRALFGKFTEHLGRNVYGGAWAEIIENPWFGIFEDWPNYEVLQQRLQSLQLLQGHLSL